MKTIQFQSNQVEKGSIYTTLLWKSISFIQCLSAFAEMYQFQSMMPSIKKHLQFYQGHIKKDKLKSSVEKFHISQSSYSSDMDKEPS